ncbi:MAG: type II secretion system F family protein [Euryarchaeota archaeon]|jgi:pilus assembly protein TadC|nr:type II secretion system F family protein [Euryarchaeota archaeon]
MSQQEEDISLIYALRGIQVLIGAGVGLESTMTHIAKGGYGKISTDFSKALNGVNRGQRLEDELKRLITTSKSDDYRRLLNSMLNNVSSNTDLISSLEQQASRAEENRTDRLKRYIEDLSGLPEKALILGFLAPLICGLAGIAPFLLGGLSGVPGVSVPPVETMMFFYKGGLFATIGLLVMMLLGAKSKDPGV